MGDGSCLKVGTCERFRAYTATTAECDSAAAGFSRGRFTWRALRRDNFKRKEAERLPAAAMFAPGDLVLIVYERGAERTSKHLYRAHGPATVLAATSAQVTPRARGSAPRPDACRAR